MVEAQYQSSTVNGLVKYQVENLTPSDCLLRLQIEEDSIEDDIKMMRQGVGQLLDIFTDVAGRELKGEDGRSISEILTPFLDVLLESRQEFNVRCHKMMEQIKVIGGKIDLVR